MTVIGDDVPDAVTGGPELGVAVTVYPLIAAPPVDMGELKETTRAWLRGAAETPVGAPGAPTTVTVLVAEEIVSVRVVPLTSPTAPAMVRVPPGAPLSISVLRFVVVS